MDEAHKYYDLHTVDHPEYDEYLADWVDNKQDEYMDYYEDASADNEAFGMLVLTFDEWLKSCGEAPEPPGDWLAKWQQEMREDATLHDADERADMEADDG